MATIPAIDYEIFRSSTKFFDEGSSTASGLESQAVDAFIASVSSSSFYQLRNEFDRFGKKITLLIGGLEQQDQGRLATPTVAAARHALQALVVLRQRLLLPEKVGPSAEKGIFIGFSSNSHRFAAVECLNDGANYAMLYDDQNYCETLMIGEGKDQVSIDDAVETIASYLREQIGPAERRR
jgi:hypothetical protein